MEYRQGWIGNEKEGKQKEGRKEGEREDTIEEKHKKRWKKLGIQEKKKTQRKENNHDIKKDKEQN